MTDEVGDFREKPTPIGTIRQIGFRAGAQDDSPPWTRDDPAVFNVGRQQIGAAVRGVDGAHILHRPFNPRSLEQVVAAHKVGVG